jgi:hypothetical protein
MKSLHSSDLNKVTAMNRPLSRAHRVTLPLRPTAPTGLQETQVRGAGTVLWYTGSSLTFTAIWGCSAIRGLSGSVSQPLQSEALT